MIFDKENLFSEDQAITATAASTNLIDLGANSSRVASAIERGKASVFAQVTADFDNLTNLAVALQTDDNSGFSSATTLRSETVLLADLVAGKQLDFGPLPVNTERYVRLNYTVTGAAPSAGTFMSGIILDAQTNV
jgi:hypothetical protein